MGFLSKIFSARKTKEPLYNGGMGTVYVPLTGTTGITVDEETALSYGAVFCAVKAISETVAMLPWRAYRESGRSLELQSGSKLDRLLHKEPNSFVTPFAWREYMIQCALLWGNAYSEIERNRLGEPIALWPIHPRRVQPIVENGELFYRVSNDDGGMIDIPRSEIFHIHGPTMNGIEGYSVISLARNSWGIGIASDRFAGSFLGNGGTPSIVIHQLEDAPDLNAEGAKNLLESFDRRHKGVGKVGKTAFLERGYKLETVGIPQKDAQFIEQRQFSVVEAARWFRIPPHKIQSMLDATYSNIESQAIEYVTDTIQPWVERLEQQANLKLTNADAIVTRIDIKGLLRGDSASRSAFYRSMWEMGVYSQNDIRAFEDENPIVGGDRYYIPLNMAPMGSQRGDDNSIMRSVLIDANQRMLNKEQRQIERHLRQGKHYSEFYEKHSAQLKEALLPALVSISNAGEILDAHINQHVARSLALISDNNMEWTGRAETETSELLNAIK